MHDSRDFQLVMAALFFDMPRPPRPIEEMSREDAMAWTSHVMQCYPGGQTAYTQALFERVTLCKIVLQLRTNDILRDDAAFSKALIQLSSKEGRTAFIVDTAKERRAIVSARRALQKAAGPRSAADPRFCSSDTQLSAVIMGRPTGPGPLYQRFLSVSTAEAAAIGPQHEIFEFDWGFVSHMQGAWSMHIAEVWQSRNAALLERFFYSWELDCEGELEAFLQQQNNSFSAYFVLGSSPLTSMTLWCPFGSFCQATFRQWIGNVFLRTILPVMATNVLDPHYKYPEELTSQ